MTLSTKTVCGYEGEPLVEEVFDESGILLSIKDLRAPFSRRSYLLPYDGIKVSVSKRFNTWEDLEALVKAPCVPIELGLPYQLGSFNTTLVGRVHQAIEMLRSSQLQVRTLHAVLAPITYSNFLEWGEIVLQIADSLGADTVTVHPNRLRSDVSREDAQRGALTMIRTLQNRHKAVIAVETFRGSRRVFLAEDLLEHGVPIVLDVAHETRDRSLWLVEQHNTLIRTIHLSAMNPHTRHLPVDRFCLDILELAMRRGWKGNVVLEYLPQYQEIMVTDLQKLIDFLEKPT